jgi:hypothetical protein
MPTDSSPEDRRYSRVRTSIYITVEAEGERRTGFVQDLSLHGFFLTCRPPLRAGAACECRLYLDNSLDVTTQGYESGPSILLQGRVARNTVLGFAVQFETVVDPDQLMHLKNLLYYNADDPDQVQREFRRARDARTGTD